MKTRTWRKPLALLLAVGLAAVPGCSGSEGKGTLPELTGELNLHRSPYMDFWMDPAVEAFQEKFPDVAVHVEDHNLDPWGEDAAPVQAALMAGQGPDFIYRPEYFFFDVKKAMSSGVFADLDPFFLADPEISKEDLEASMLSVGQSKGKQYVVPLTYSIPLLLTSKEALAEFGMDEQEIRKGYLETERQIAAYLERRQDPPVFSGPRVGANYAERLGLEYLDYENQTVNFSYPEFKEAAELYKPFWQLDLNAPSYEGTGPDTEAARVILDRKAVFYDYMSSNGVTPLQNARALAGAGETPLLIPVRGVDGKTTAGVFHAMAIRSGGNQRNAWEFMKILLSEENLNSNVNMRTFPVRKSCLQARLDRAMEAPEGTVVDFEGRELIMAALPEGVKKDYQAAYEDIGHGTFSFGVLPAQVEYHLTEFYEGTKSLDACISALENDLSIMISE